jgi:hypothetical protein
MSVRALALLIRILVVALLCSTASVPRSWADPLTVTSGQFHIPWDDPTFFAFAGADGFILSSLFVGTPSSPQNQCFRGCTAGTAVSLGALAGGVSPFTRFPLGTVTGAVINGQEFQPPGSLEPDSPRLAGTLRFDAPIRVLPPLDGSFSLILTAPFTLTGQVAGFAADDLEARLPLFELGLRGQGTLRAVFDTFGGQYGQAEVTYTFAPGPAPVPEPTSLVLLGSGLAGIGIRRYRKNRRRRHKDPLPAM